MLSAAADQAARLIRDLQTVARNARHPAPLLIAVDQENGGVNSLYDEILVQQFPSALGVAAAGSPELARAIAKATAHQLAAVGVNLILGPVLDVLSDGRAQPLGARSLGEDPTSVATYAVEYVRGYHDAGIAACGKHFPSYGNLDFLRTQADMPVISDAPDKLAISALAPFRAAVSATDDAGAPAGVDAMLVGGCVVSALGADAATHACLSPPIVDGLLRRDLGFDGVVMSECLEMDSLGHSLGVGRGTVMAVNAGCDLLLLCRSLPAQQEAFAAVRAGAEAGAIAPARLRRSLARIAALKARATSWDRALGPPGTGLLSVLQPSHAALSREAYDRSVTVVRDRDHLLPISSMLAPHESLLLLTPHLKPLAASALSARMFELPPQPPQETHTHEPPHQSPFESVFRELGRTLARQRHGRVMHASYTSTGLATMHEQLVGRAHAVVVVIADANRHRFQASFTKHLALLCAHAGDGGRHKAKPLIVVAVSSPYEFATDETIGTYVCTYDFSETALQTLANILCGNLVPSGVLPGLGSLDGKGMSEKRSYRGLRPRENWLVENFNMERDGAALDALLAAVQAKSEGEVAEPGAVDKIAPDGAGLVFGRSELANVKASSFLLGRPQDVAENHFVVRSGGAADDADAATANGSAEGAHDGNSNGNSNGSTPALYGFCATYVFRATRTAVVGAILVAPDQQRRGIGSALHARAVRALAAAAMVQTHSHLYHHSHSHTHTRSHSRSHSHSHGHGHVHIHRPEPVRRFQLGCRLPGVYLGVPTDRPAERRRLRAWLADRGWNMALSRPVFTMVLRLRPVSRWREPEGGILGCAEVEKVDDSGSKRKRAPEDEGMKEDGDGESGDEKEDGVGDGEGASGDAGNDVSDLILDPDNPLDHDNNPNHSQDPDNVSEESCHSHHSSSPPPSLTPSSSDDTAHLTFDYLYNRDQIDAARVIDHVRTSARPGVMEMYRLAVADDDIGSGILRARRCRDGAILGTAVVIGGNGFAGSGDGGRACVDHTPIRAAGERAGGVAAPVVSPAVGGYAALMQSLIVAGVKIVRQLGADAVVLDCVCALFPPFSSTFCLLFFLTSCSLFWISLSVTT